VYRRQSCRPRVGRPRITRSRATRSPLVGSRICRLLECRRQTGRRRETRPRRSRQHGHHLRLPRPQGFRLRESRVRRCRPMGHRGPPVRLGPFCRRSPGRTRRNRCPTSRPSGRHPGFLATSACREPRRRAQSSSAPGRRALRRPVACRRVIPTNQELDSQASWNQVLAQWARDRRLGHGGRRPVSISQHSVRREVPGDWNLSLPGGLPPRRRQDRHRWCRPCLRCPHRYSHRRCPRQGYRIPGGRAPASPGQESQGRSRQGRRRSGRRCRRTADNPPEMLAHGLDPRCVTRPPRHQCPRLDLAWFHVKHHRPRMNVRPLICGRDLSL
jgi:hypothetical protein